MQRIITRNTTWNRYNTVNFLHFLHIGSRYNGLDCMWSYKHIGCYVSVGIGVIEPANSIIALRSGQLGRQFASKRCIFSTETVFWFKIRSGSYLMVDLFFFPNDPNYNKLPLAQVINWCPTGDKPLTGVMMTRMTAHTWVTWPQWICWIL